MEWTIDEVKLSNLLKSTIATICTNIFFNQSSFSINGEICVQVNNGLYKIVIDFNDVYEIANDYKNLIKFNSGHGDQGYMVPQILNMNTKINNSELGKQYNQSNHKINLCENSIRHMASYSRENNLFQNTNCNNYYKTNYDVNSNNVSSRKRLFKSNLINQGSNKNNGEHTLYENKTKSYLSLLDTFVQHEQQQKCQVQNINSHTPNVKLILKSPKLNQCSIISRNKSDFQNKLLALDLSNSKEYNKLNQNKVVNKQSFMYFPDLPLELQKNQVHTNSNLLEKNHLPLLSESNNCIENTDGPTLSKKINLETNMHVENTVVPTFSMNLITSTPNKLKSIICVPSSSPITKLINATNENNNLNDLNTIKFNIPIQNSFNLTPVKYQSNSICSSPIILPQNNLKTDLIHGDNFKNTCTHKLSDNSNINKNGQIINTTLQDNINITPFFRAPLAISEEPPCLLSPIINIPASSTNKFEKNNFDILAEKKTSQCLNSEIELIDDNNNKSNSIKNEELIEIQKRQILLAQQAHEKESVRQKSEKIQDKESNISSNNQKSVDFNASCDLIDDKIVDLISNKINMNKSCHEEINSMNISESTPYMNMDPPNLNFHDDVNENNVSSSTLENIPTLLNEAILNDLYSNENVNENNIENNITNYKRHSSNLMQSTDNNKYDFNLIDNIFQLFNEELPLIEKFKEANRSNNLNLKQQIHNECQNLYNLKKCVLIALEAILNENQINKEILEKTKDFIKCFDKNNELRSFKSLSLKSIITMDQAKTENDSSVETLSNYSDIFESDISSFEISTYNVPTKKIKTLNQHFEESRIRDEVNLTEYYSSDENSTKYVIPGKSIVDDFDNSNQRINDSTYSTKLKTIEDNYIEKEIKSSSNHKKYKTLYKFANSSSFVKKEKQPIIQLISCKFCGKKMKDNVELAKHISKLHHNNLSTIILVKDIQYKKKFEPYFIEPE